MLRKTTIQIETDNDLDALIQKARQDGRHGTLMHFMKMKAFVRQLPDRHQAS